MIVFKYVISVFELICSFTKRARVGLSVKIAVLKKYVAVEYDLRTSENDRHSIVSIVHDAFNEI